MIIPPPSVMMKVPPGIGVTIEINPRNINIEPATKIIMRITSLSIHLAIQILLPIKFLAGTNAPRRTCTLYSWLFIDTLTDWSVFTLNATGHYIYCKIDCRGQPRNNISIKTSMDCEVIRSRINPILTSRVRLPPHFGSTSPSALAVWSIDYTREIIQAVP